MIPAFFVVKALGPMHVTVQLRDLNDRAAAVGRATVLLVDRPFAGAATATASAD